MQVQTEEKKITFNCPKCAATLKVPRQLAGVSGPCPKCGGTIVAPHPTPVESATPPPQVQEAPPSPEREPQPTPASPPRSLSTRMPVASGPVEPVDSRPRPAPVEIEDLNDSPEPKPQPEPVSAESGKPNGFPQSYPTSNPSKHEDSLEPESESFDDIVPGPAASHASTPREPEVNQSPSPQPPVSQPEATSQKQDESEDIQVQTTPRTASQAVPQAQPGRDVPTLSPENQQTAPTSSPRVSVSTIPARPKQASPAPQQQPARRTISANTVSRIRRGGRLEAQAASNTEGSETRPISPVKKPDFQEPTQAQPSAAAPAATNTGSAPASPRLDASLGESTTNLDKRNLPSGSPPQRISGPTKIRLPQLNGEPEPAPPAAQPTPTPPVQNPAPPQNEYVPQNTAAPAQPAPAAPPMVEQRMPLEQPRQEPETHLPPVARNDAPPVDRRSREDRGLGDLILEDSHKLQEGNDLDADASELDELFGPANQPKEKRNKTLWIKVGVAAAVLSLAIFAVIMIGNAFGGFGMDKDGDSTNGDNTAANANDKPAVERPPEKPAIAPPSTETDVVETTGSTPPDPNETPEANSIADSGSPDQPKASTPAEAPKVNNGFDKLVLTDSNETYSTDTTGNTDNSIGSTMESPSDREPIIFDTPATVVPPGNEDIADKIRERIENATNAISQGPTATIDDGPTAPEIGSTTTDLAPKPEIKVPEVETTASIPEPQPQPQPQPASTSTGSGPTGEFRNSTPANPAAMNGPPGPESFTPPSGQGSKLGSTRELIDTFLKSPRWEDQIPYVYQADKIKPVMEAYYQHWPYRPMEKFALKFEQMESDPDLNGPFWIYNVNTSDNTTGFPIVVRQEGELLKVDWGVQAEFRDELFAKFQNGDLTGKQSFRLILERQTAYYGSDAEAFTNIGDYLVYRIAPPYGGNDYEEVALVSKNSPVGKELNELVPLYSQPLAVIVELENQSFPHGIKHLVITKVVTDGWFQ